MYWIATLIFLLWLPSSLMFTLSCMWHFDIIHRNRDGADWLRGVFPPLRDDVVFWQSSSRHWKCELISRNLNISHVWSDRGFLFFAQILFVSGLSFVIGLERTFRFFFQWHKVKATSFFLGGVLVVLMGWPIVGVILEIYGFFLLFRWVKCCFFSSFI